MDPDRRALRVTVTDGRGCAARAPGLAAWLARIAPAAAQGDVAVALVSDAHIRSLNRRYRGHDKPTDVLSFQADAADPHLGDIVIAKGVAWRQAREAGHTYAAELRVLALHGLLHLLGYDHHNSADRNRMARLERRLRAAGGLHAGLIERSKIPAATDAGRATVRRRGNGARRREAGPPSARPGRVARREH